MCPVSSCCSSSTTCPYTRATHAVHARDRRGRPSSLNAELQDRRIAEPVNRDTNPERGTLPIAAAPVRSLVPDRRLRAFRRTRSGDAARERRSTPRVCRGGSRSCLDETIGRLRRSCVWRRMAGVSTTDVADRLVALDEELTALRPSSTARRASRAMGLRLLTDVACAPSRSAARAMRWRWRSAAPLGPTLPVAFARRAPRAGVDAARRRSRPLRTRGWRRPCQRRCG